MDKESAELFPIQPNEQQPAWYRSRTELSGDPLQRPAHLTCIGSSEAIANQTPLRQLVAGIVNSEPYVRHTLVSLDSPRSPEIAHSGLTTVQEFEQILYRGLHGLDESVMKGIVAELAQIMFKARQNIIVSIRSATTQREMWGFVQIHPVGELPKKTDPHKFICAKFPQPELFPWFDEISV